MVQPLDQSTLVKEVGSQIQWWVTQRVKKLKEQSHETMSVNPFLAPLILRLHDMRSFEDLAAFLLVGHLATGYATGFGKLVDERILPKVFRTVKLDKKFRKGNAPYNLPVFGEIDHLIRGQNDQLELLSLKAGRWTIQLTMAVQLNAAFHQLVQLRDVTRQLQFKQIVVGVFYGTEATLTDKYDILRGICSGAQHDVTDLKADVVVKAGRAFWAWLNQGQEQTQEWVMDGILRGLQDSTAELTQLKELLTKYQKSFAGKFQAHIQEDQSINWHGILREING